MPHGAPLLDVAARAKHPRQANSQANRRGADASPLRTMTNRDGPATARHCVTLAKSYNPLRYTEIQKVNRPRGWRPGRVACAMGRAVTGWEIPGRSRATRAARFVS